MRDAGKIEESWGCSSAGRAPRSQRGGQRFDPAQLHQIPSASELRKSLTEEVLHFLEQAGRGGLIVHGEGFRELGDQFALCAAQLSGDLDQHLDDQVAFASFIQEGNAAPAHAQLASALGSLGDLHGDRAVDSGHFELCAERGLREADGNDAVEVVAVALEEIVRPYGEDYVEIAFRSAGTSGIAFAGVADTRTVFDAGRDFYVELDFSGGAAFATACGQGSEMTEPAPLHAPQVRATEKKPCW